MANPNGIRTVLLLIPPLFMLLPVSILVFVLERISQSLFVTQALRDWRSGGEVITFYGPSSNSTDPSDYDYTDVNILINYAPTAAIIGIAVVAYIVSTLGTCGIWELRRIEGTMSHQRGWCWVTLVTNFALTAASVGVLIYASTLQGNEKRWQSYADVGKPGQRFTRETWVCQIDQFYPKQNWAGPSCALSKATRFMLIPLALSSALTCLCTWLLVRDRGGTRWLFGGKGRYGAFDSLYEMQPSGPIPYIQPPGFIPPAPIPQPWMQPTSAPQAPMSPPPGSQAQKMNATVEERAVYR